MFLKKCSYKFILFATIICVVMMLNSCKKADIKQISTTSEYSNFEESTNYKNKKAAKRLR